MVLEGTGRLYQHAKGRVVLYIAAELHKDSAFPFEVGEAVKIKIDGKKLVVEKEEKDD